MCGFLFVSLFFYWGLFVLKGGFRVGYGVDLCVGEVLGWPCGRGLFAGRVGSNGCFCQCICLWVPGLLGSGWSDGGVVSLNYWGLAGCFRITIGSARAGGGINVLCL